jgi:hypothetical protein
MLHRRSALHQLAVGALALLLPGCATLPEYREDAVTTAEVILNIKCEIVRAAYGIEEHAWARDWVVGSTASFLIDHSGSVDVDAGFLFPLAHGASFNAGLTGGFLGSASRTERIEFREPISKMEKEVGPLCADNQPEHFARLGGQLGIADLLARVTVSMREAKISPKSLSYNLDFVIKKSASATPRFNVVPLASEKVFTGNLKLGAERKDTHRLEISMVPPDKDPPCPVDVVHGRCPQLVHVVGIDQSLPIRRSSGDRRNFESAPTFGAESPAPVSASSGKRRRSRSAAPASNGISRSEEQRLDAASTRNILQNIDDRLAPDIR